MKYKRLELDFRHINTLEEMHLMLKKVFGFPNFYGKNVNALIDCLSDLRYPEYGMSEYILNSEEVLILNLVGFSTKNKLIVNHFITAIEGVNEKNQYANQSPSIYLLLT